MEVNPAGSDPECEGVAGKPGCRFGMSASGRVGTVALHVHPFLFFGPFLAGTFA